ncbi:MAG: SRPBCC family protein [Burkholderiales bacterium]|nr:SRPBCC family protein [Burkholderiales bacterium]MCZ7560820.1 SRPBCC family protein [Burkholderiaceae bacterium]
MIRAIVLLAVLAVAAVLLYATTRPDTFRVERMASIRAPAAKIHPLIADLRQFNTWNPYEKKDPDLKGRYRGAPSGPGAGYDFEGNKDVGKGSIEIVESAPPTRVAMKLDMLAPFEAHNLVEFTLAPRGEATEVTWSMRGPSPFVARLVGVFMDMDRMIGRDFEAGLANLKAIAERP